MIIIWGWRSRTKTTGRGEFHCPSCRTAQPYEQKRIARYFTLYFVPLFPIKTLLEYVECGACHVTWKPGVLDAPRPEPVAARTAAA